MLDIILGWTYIWGIMQKITPIESLKAPVIYIPNFIQEPEASVLLTDLWADLPWLDARQARRECWMNDFDSEYSYSEGRGELTYEAQPWDARLKQIQHRVEAVQGKFQACFVNGYANEKNALGWHADDSDGIRHSEPIAIVSFGAERIISFRPQGSDPDQIESIVLGHGSLCLMRPGMQQTHFHKIPKHDRPCGVRISLTYRTLLSPGELAALRAEKARVSA